MEKYQLIENAKNISEVNVTIEDKVGKYLLNKINYLSEYMGIEAITCSGKEGNEQDNKDLYQVMIFSYLKGNWRFING